MPRTTPPGVGELFDALTEEIDEATGLDFALLAPDLMRLQLLAWASYARDLQDRFPRDETEHRTRGVIGRLSRFGKLHWPGAVAPLRQAMSPTEAGCSHGFADAPQDWFHLAEMAEERLATLREGRDEYGWADAAALPPPPADPRSRLVEVRSALDKHLGAASVSDSEFREAAQRLTRGAVQTLTAAARLLRWLRGCVEPNAWGEVMGRMRRLAGARRDQGLNEAIDPAFSPPKSWFLQLRSAAARGRLRIVGPALAATEAEFIEWLRTTADRLDLTALRIALRGQLDRLCGVNLATALQGADFSALRRRLRRLMDDSQDTQAAPGDSSVESLEETGSLLDEAEAEPATAADEIQPRSIVEQARGRVDGQHALFLSNRADPDLERRLTESLGLTLDWCVVSQMRTVQSAAERVRGRAYDFVLLATGFMGHDAEAIIRDAARGSDVPVVRAGKGRVLASAQAILRDLA